MTRDQWTIYHAFRAAFADDIRISTEVVQGFLGKWVRVELRGRGGICVSQGMPADYASDPVVVVLAINAARERFRMASTLRRVQAIASMSAQFATSVGEVQRALSATEAQARELSERAREIGGSK